MHVPRDDHREVLRLHLVSAALELPSCYSSFDEGDCVCCYWVASILSILVIATFFVYFKDATAGFSSRAIPEDAPPAALEAWST